MIEYRLDYLPVYPCLFYKLMKPHVIQDNNLEIIGRHKNSVFMELVTCVFLVI